MRTRKDIPSLPEVITGGGKEAEKRWPPVPVCWALSVPLAFQMSRNPISPESFTLIWFFIRWILFHLKCRFSIFPSFSQSFSLLSPSVPPSLPHPASWLAEGWLSRMGRISTHHLHWSPQMPLHWLCPLTWHRYPTGNTFQCFMHILYLNKLLQNTYYSFVCLCEGL